MKFTGRFMRWMMIVGASGVMPAFIMRCDKAALNFQRSFFEQWGVITANGLAEADFFGLNQAG